MIRGRHPLLACPSHIPSQFRLSSPHPPFLVNTQMCIATLMACADDPNHVPGPGDWRVEADGGVRVPSHRRVPIIVTGNDLSRLFAPLLRDG